MVGQMESGRSIAGVLQDILTNVQTIIRAEVRLAKAEVRDEATKAISSAIWLFAGAVTAVCALTFALWTVAYALATVWPMWAAALAVAVVLGAASALLITAGVKRLKRVSPVPRQTVDTIRENAEWVRQSIR
jgi:uncharacterized membrane protein YqjE